jgi:hypothetical protein
VEWSGEHGAGPMRHDSVPAVERVADDAGDDDATDDDATDEVASDEVASDSRSDSPATDADDLTASTSARDA